jgi:Coatomer gamma subunit appendage platform subdomain
MLRAALARVLSAQSACRKKGKGKAAEQAAAAAAVAPPDEEELGKELVAMPQFAALGPRFKTCRGVRVTEEDTEYLITCVKHVFAAHIVLQFNCINTIADQVRACWLWRACCAQPCPGRTGAVCTRRRRRAACEAARPSPNGAQPRCRGAAGARSPRRLPPGTHSDASRFPAAQRPCCRGH